MMEGKQARLDRRAVAGWCLYDFANSSYSAVIAAVIFPVYFTKVIVGNEAGLGDLWWGRAISTSMAFVAATSPFLGGIADHTGRRRFFLLSFTLLAVISVGMMSILEPGMILTGFLLILLANIGMEGGLVFYNAYLPGIAPPEYRGRVSAWGFSLGYAGSMIALAAALPLVKAGRFGPVWLGVSFFFLIFSMPLLTRRQDDGPRRLGARSAALSGLRDSLQGFREILVNKPLRRFLAAYLLYEDGVNTVIVFSSIFAATTLGMETGELIVLYLVVQMTALAGSAVMAKPIDTWGPRPVILLSLVLWVSVTVLAYFVTDKNTFWGVAVVAGSGLGTIQAASRAYFSRFIPHGKEAEYFGVYALVGKTSAVLGPLIFGHVSAAAGSQRPAILSISLLFVGGAALLAGLRNDHPQ